jgi:hypothetical protein
LCRVASRKSPRFCPPNTEHWAPCLAHRASCLAPRPPRSGDWAVFGRGVRGAECGLRSADCRVRSGVGVRTLEVAHASCRLPSRPLAGWPAVELSAKSRATKGVGLGVEFASPRVPEFPSS